MPICFQSLKILSTFLKRLQNHIRIFWFYPVGDEEKCTPDCVCVHPVFLDGNVFYVQFILFVQFSLARSLVSEMSIDNINYYRVHSLELKDFAEYIFLYKSRLKNTLTCHLYKRNVYIENVYISAFSRIFILSYIRNDNGFSTKIKLRNFTEFL